MNADTESNVDTARSRAERLIDQGAHVLVGAFDSGHTAAIAQVAEQRGVPHIVNIAAAPQITEQGYKFVFRNFPPAPEIGRNGLVLLGDIFAEAKVSPKTAVFMHVNDTFGQSMAKGVAALLPKVSLPFKLLDTIPYDPAAKDLTVEVSKAKATNAELLLLVCRLNDAIVLRREMVKQRWNPHGVVSPGSPGLYEEQFSKGLGKYADYCITNTVWFNPKNEITHAFAAAVQEALPEGRVRVSRHQRVLHLRRPSDRRRRVQAREEHGSQGAHRGDPADRHPRDRSGHVRRADQVQREGPGRG